MSKHENDNKRYLLKAVLVVLVIAVIAVLAYAGKLKFGGEEQSTSNNKGNIVESGNKATGSNEVKEPEVEPKEEPEVEPEKPDENKENEEKKESEESSVSDEQKAKELALKQYGSTDGVYAYIDDNIGNGIYVVSIRKSGETSALAWYRVDVKNLKVTDF